jgi:DNA-binding transcriptional LysR family regulator
MKELLETSEILAFVQTVEARSLTRAARSLGVPRATLGRRLARLEERLGARLLRRTTRRMVLTDEGEAFLQEARVVLDATRRAEAIVGRGAQELRGVVRVTAPPTVREDFLDLFCAFAAAHPKVTLQVYLTTEHVDLVRDGYDVALRAGAKLPPGFVARVLVRTERWAVAAPAYVAKHGLPRSARELADHQCLMGFVGGIAPESHWRFAGKSVRVQPSFTSNSMELLRQGALRGLGIAMLPDALVKNDVKQGVLVRVLEGVLGEDARMAIVYPEKQMVAPQVRAFIDFVAEGAKRIFAG